MQYSSVGVLKGRLFLPKVYGKGIFFCQITVNERVRFVPRSFRVVRKPINTNSGLKGDRVFYFSCLVFFIANVLWNLSLC